MATKYDNAMEAINNILAKDPIIDDDNGIISVYDLCELMNSEFKEYLQAFYGNHDSLNTTLYQSGFCRRLEFVKPMPYFSQDFYRIEIEIGGLLYYFYQEKGSDVFYFSDDQFDEEKLSIFYKHIEPVITKMFKLMRKCEAYSDELMPYYSDSLASFAYEVFNVEINLTEDGFNYNFYFSDIESFYQNVLWSDKREPLSKLIGRLQEDLVKRIPIDVNSLNDSNLLKKAYNDSKTLDKHVKQKVR